MDITQLPFNRHIGLKHVADCEEDLLELPANARYANHLGTVHSSALFALAEAASGAFLKRNLDLGQTPIIPILRKADIKYRKPAIGAIRANGVMHPDDWRAFHENFERKRRAIIAFQIELLDQFKTLVASGNFEWFIAESKSE